MRWTDFDRPVLQAIYDLEGESDGVVDGRRITEATEIEERELTRSINYLYGARLHRSHGRVERQSRGDLVRRITPSGLAAIGQWPSPEAVAVVLPDMIRDLAAERVDPDERNLLERIIENVSTGVLTTVATRYFPGL